MPPAKNKINCSLGNSKSFSKHDASIYSGKISFSDFYNFFLRKFRISVLRTTFCHISIFKFPVLHVFQMCTKEKMIRIYAHCVVAFMKNVQTVGNWPVMDYPGDTVASLDFFSSIGTTANTKTSIAMISVHTPLPYPATVSFGDVLKKTIFNWHGWLIRHSWILPCQ